MATLEASIDFGSEAEFLSANGTIYNAVAMLSDSKFVVAYQDNSDLKHGTVKIGEVSGTTVTFGAETEYFSLNNYDNALHITVLDESTFVVAYQDESDSGHGTAKVGVVSGTSVTFGSAFEYTSTDRAAYNDIATLDSTHFVIAYSDWADSKRGKVKIGTITGTDISFGSASTFMSDTETVPLPVSVACFDSSTFVIGYGKGSASSYHGAARIGTVVGAVITLYAETEFISLPNAQPNVISIDTLSSSKFVIMYTDTIDSSHGTVKIGDVDGTSITFGTEAEFLSADGSSQNRVRKLDSSHFAIVYRDGFDSNHGTAKIGTVIGTDVTFSDESEFLEADGSVYVSLTALNANKFVVAYTDASDFNHGTVKIGIISWNSMGDTGIPLRTIHHLIRTGDYNPQLTSTFNIPPTNVNIEIWDIVDGQNTQVVITNSNCYVIGNTSEWGWSTEYLPLEQEHKKYHYYFKMTSDENEKQYGEFFIAVPERGRWSYID